MKLTPLQFVNTYLRTASEKRLTEGEFSRMGFKARSTHDLRWQVAVRRFFYGNKPFERLT